MIYFDNAATGGEKPDNVLSAVEGAIRVCANPGRSGHTRSIATANLVLSARKTLANYFDCADYERVIFTKNCTEALNIGILSLLKKGDHVLTTVFEHNSVLRPLEIVKNQGVEVSICPLQEGEFSLSLFLSLLRPNTKLVVLTSASNVTGEVLPIQQIRSSLPKEVLLMVDGAQGAGHVPLLMGKMGIDLLAVAGHKGLMGIQGSGALLFSERVQLSPLLFGGTGSESFSLSMPDFYPDRLEAGTLSFPAILSLLEGVRFLQNRKDLPSTLYFYTEYLIEKLRKIEGYTVYSKPNPCGIVAFQKADMQSEFVASILSERYAIAVRGGLHCAPLIHQALGTMDGGLVRVSFSIFNHLWEIDTLLSALEELSTQSPSTF